MGRFYLLFFLSVLLVLALVCARTCTHIFQLCLSKQRVCVCAWHKLFHLVSVSVCGQLLCLSWTKSVNVKTGWTLPVWSLDSTGNRCFQKSPVTCFLFKCLKKNKHLSGKAREFSLLASVTSNRASGPHYPGELKVQDRMRETEAKNDKWKKNLARAHLLSEFLILWDGKCNWSKNSICVSFNLNHRQKKLEDSTTLHYYGASSVTASKEPCVNLYCQSTNLHTQLH